MVGEGVLLECLRNPAVDEVLVVTRRPTGIADPKLRELVLQDFFQVEPVAAHLSGYDGCFFCLGVSSAGMDKEEYRHLTYDLTLGFAEVLVRVSPEIAFCYVSGAGTDTSEQGRFAWARVKGALENALLRLLPRSTMFRPGFMRATPGQKNVKSYYKYINWLYPIGRAVYPGGFCTVEEVGRAMIHAAKQGAPKRVLEVKDIVALASAAAS